jgi:hypothetical protein
MTTKATGDDTAAGYNRMLQCAKNEFYSQFLERKLIQRENNMVYNRINIMESLKFLQYLRDWASVAGHDLGNEIETSKKLYHNLLKAMESKKTDKTETIYELIRNADEALDKRIQEALSAEKAKAAS